MRHAVTTVFQNATIVGGFLSIVMAGIRVYIDRRAEEYFVELEPHAYAPEVLREVEWFVNKLGYVIMDEWECPAEDLPTGAIRLWMAEKEVVHDRSSLQAV